MKTIDSAPVDYTAAPHDYADLFRTYFPYVVSLVGRMGIDRSRTEDVASDILLRFYERGFLEKFDPTLVFEHDGQTRPARFKSFLSKFVLSYVRGHRDRQHRQTAREPLLCDAMYPGADSTGEVTWVEIFGTSHPDHGDAVIDRLDYLRTVAALREYLALVPRRSKTDTCDLVALFDAVVAQVDQHGEINIAALRRRFAVSGTAMHTWIWWLRANLADAVGLPLPRKRPRASRTRA